VLPEVDRRRASTSRLFSCLHPSTQVTCCTILRANVPVGNLDWHGPSKWPAGRCDRWREVFRGRMGFMRCRGGLMRAPWYCPKRETTRNI